ncbi:uncharacterized protein MELLADRAFT_58886 [Melampsora larici-populina 98AG31]|uniref:Secreted protein n=1 Tax=Melampsora larici-populina (strain 98AG31 / pathotype 3-4-7) TaxID=747676 RepID=F4R6A4_MELLP|nr:uncharacterized protein MELLADRAFT_58886 [Melampsora larici-populina 98AG31]EGG12498.1 hypothetical protein MELLADRAFT_58886 [Melampsora larici-populina 98AG31]
MEMKSLCIFAPYALMILCGLVKWCDSHPATISEIEVPDLAATTMEGDVNSRELKAGIADFNSGHKADPSLNILKNVDADKNQNAAKAGEDFKSLAGDDARVSPPGKEGQPNTPAEGEKKSFLKKIRSFFRDGPVKFWKKIKQWFSKANIFKRDDKKLVKIKSFFRKNWFKGPKPKKSAVAKSAKEIPSPMQPQEDKAVRIEKMEDKIPSNNKEVEVNNPEPIPLASSLDQLEDKAGEIEKMKDKIPSNIKEVEVNNPEPFPLASSLDQLEDESVGIEKMEDKIPSNNKEVEVNNPEPIPLASSLNQLDKPQVDIKPSKLVFLDEKAEEVIISVEDILKRHNVHLDEERKSLLEQKIKNPTIIQEPISPLTTPAKDYKEFLEYTERSLRDVNERYSIYVDIIEKTLIEEARPKLSKTRTPVSHLESSSNNLEISEAVAPTAESRLVLTNTEVNLLETAERILDNAVTRNLASINSLQKVILEVNRDPSSFGEKTLAELFLIKETVDKAFASHNKI